MARKKMVKGKLYDPESQQYWDQLLEKQGLGMGVGTTSKLSYGGTTSDLEWLEGLQTGGSRKTEAKKPSE